MSKKPNLKSQVLSKINEVLDPELGISIVDLGLVYKVTLPKVNKVKVIMSLTTIGCPLFPSIEREVQNRIQELGFKEKDIKIELTFDPPWSMEKMSKKGKMMLGI